MAQIFPKWTNYLPAAVVIAMVALIVGTTGFFYYYGSPKYTDVGYRPIQPVHYSHKLHAGDLGIDCRYCHFDVESSPVANLPMTQICMNCHKIVGTDNDRLLPVRESWSSNMPILWVRVHELPDYAYFNHSAHLWAGVGCSSCHGNVAAMDVVIQRKPLSMGWCLDCHRNPAPNLRPQAEITNTYWTQPADQVKIASQIIEEKSIAAPTDCSGCHR